MDHLEREAVYEFKKWVSKMSTAQSIGGGVSDRTGIYVDKKAVIDKFLESHEKYRPFYAALEKSKNGDQIQLWTKAHEELFGK